jgi:hypothetical protein
VLTLLLLPLLTVVVAAVALLVVLMMRLTAAAELGACCWPASFTILLYGIPPFAKFSSGCVFMIALHTASRTTQVRTSYN